MDQQLIAFGRRGFLLGVLAPVRIRAAQILSPIISSPTVWIYDTFSRTVSSGWGTPNVGAAWTVTGTAADYSTTGSVGKFAGSFAFGRANCSTTPAGSFQAIAQFGDLQTSDARQTGFRLRVQNSATNFYRCYWQRSDHILYVDRVISGSGTNIASQSKTDPGASVTVKFSIENNSSGNVVVKGKVWVTGSAEPGSWDLTVTDSNAAKLTADGSFAVELGNNGSTQATIDNLLVTSIN